MPFLTTKQTHQHIGRRWIVKRFNRVAFVEVRTKDGQATVYMYLNDGRMYSEVWSDPHELWWWLHRDSLRGCPMLWNGAPVPIGSRKDKNKPPEDLV